MARIKKTSAAEDVVDIVAAMPWWAGVALAILFYLVLSSMASTRLVTAASSPEQMSQVMVGMMTQILAEIGQYLVPLLCLAGAGISFVRRRKRAQLVDKVVTGAGSRPLQEISWQEFEQLVGEAFRRRGFAVKENGGGGADGGIDLVLSKNGEKFVVQCKQWRAMKVGVTVIRELYGVMAAGGAAGGFVVTCGTFTEEAKAFAKGRNLILLGGSELEKMMRETPRAPAARPVATPATAGAGRAHPNCPLCANSMLLRTAQRGANAGKQFWGCSTYPSCRGTVSAE